jgi:hypothetical protein
MNRCVKNNFHNLDGITRGTRTLLFRLEFRSRRFLNAASRRAGPSGRGSTVGPRRVHFSRARREFSEKSCLKTPYSQQNPRDFRPFAGAVRSGPFWNASVWLERLSIARA